MRVLVYGAGVIGCELAHVLCRAKNDVTVLARGEWKETLEKNGLRIRHYAQLATTIDTPRVIGELNPEDEYDIIFAALQYCNMAEAIPVLSANCSRRIVLVGNNMDAAGALERLTRNRSDREVAFGFQGTGGRRENGRVISIHLKPGMTLGPVRDLLSPEFCLLLERAFYGARYRLKWESDMDAWLKSHLAFILPICYVCYATNGVLSRAAKGQLNDVIDAAQEAHAMLKNLGYAIRPDGEESFFVEGRKKCFAFLRLMAKTPLGKLAASDHAMRAVGEMQALDEAFERLRERSGVAMPTWERLRANGNPQRMQLRTDDTK